MTSPASLAFRLYIAKVDYMNKKPKPITPEAIDKILKFLPVFEQVDRKFSEWHSTEPSEDGTPHLPYCEYTSDVNDFIQTLYEEGFIIFFNWIDWKYRKRLYDEPQLVKRAKLETLQKLLTAHIRQERFCEGHLALSLTNGHINAILHRLKELRNKMKE